MKKHILIRAYGSHLMGMGHLYRMRLIIDEFQKDPQIEISLLTRAHEESIALYSSLNVDHLYELDPALSEVDEIAYATNTLNDRYDCILNDQLKTSEAVGAFLSQLSPSVVSIDDVGSGARNFQGLINVLYSNNPSYDHEETSFKYLILPNFQTIRSQYILNQKAARIFINQGAADTWGAIPDIITDLNAIPHQVTLRVLLGPAFKHYAELVKALENSCHKIELYNSTDCVVDLARDCDIAILGAGNTLFEVASIGVPVVGCTREEKELITIKRLLDSNIIAGHLELYHGYSLKDSIMRLIDNYDIRMALSESGKENFSYDGLKNIIKKIKEML